MGDQLSRGRRAGASGEADTAGNVAARLRVDGGRLGLADLARADMGHMAVSPHPSRLCEEILGQLLQGLEGVDHAAAARTIIGHFGSLKAALSAPAIAQMRACGDLRAVRIMRAVRRATFWMQRRDLDERISLANPSCAFDYLHLSLGMESREQVRLLLLDGRQRLIRDDLVSQGGVDSAELSVRDVIVRGLEAGASALILVHNHPSGG
ncbi:JAB domain-containing protein [Sphingomonas sp. 7/4-4]|uniref:JAB domain-containing protein n=1 Tax=Sphingomonas sp. 7/4-4 TaxID=3018446 RepID=UPI0022F3A3B6|nr:JAB domain-containing protein [Sphingomonas sp. 7/4-4]WBY08160.1 JAB domain-containing protein [Sphingomonas sp. 7/4-4]